MKKKEMKRRLKALESEVELLKVILTSQNQPVLQPFSVPMKPVEPYYTTPLTWPHTYPATCTTLTATEN